MKDQKFTVFSKPAENKTTVYDLFILDEIRPCVAEQAVIIKECKYFSEDSKREYFGL